VVAGTMRASMEPGVEFIGPNLSDAVVK
jgi:hypothetical protein